MGNGSYPSTHAAVGWAWALILSEIAPDQTDSILARGRAFGQSRVVCNVHWESDVIEGRFIGAAAVARLHSDSTFLADLEAAKAELAAVHLVPPNHFVIGLFALKKASQSQTETFNRLILICSLAVVAAFVWSECQRILALFQ